MKYKVVEVFADNGELSHIKVLNADTGETISDQSLELSMAERKAIVRGVRKREDHFMRRKAFCDEHKMRLDAIRLEDMFAEAGRFARELQTKLETGFVGSEE